MSLIRREDGTIRKANPQVTQSIESDLLRLKAGKARAERMATLKDHEAWADIREVVNRRLQQINRSLEDFNQKRETDFARKLDYRDIEFLLQERKDFTLFLSIVDEAESGISLLETKIEEYEKQLESRKPANAPV